MIEQFYRWEMIGIRVLSEGVRRMECCLNWDGWDLWGMDVPSAGALGIGGWGLESMAFGLGCFIW